MNTECTAGDRTAAERTRASRRGCRRSLQSVAIFCPPPRRSSAGSRAHIADDHDLAQARNLLHHLRHGPERIERLPAVEVAVRGDEHLRLDLAEAIEHAVRRRSPASTRTRWRRCWRWPAWRWPLRGHSAGSPPRDLPLQRPRPSAPRRRAPPRHAARDTRARAACRDRCGTRWRAGDRETAAGSRRNSAVRSGRSVRPACDPHSRSRAPCPNPRARRRSAPAPSRNRPGSLSTTRTGRRSPASFRLRRAFTQVMKRVTFASATRADEGLQIGCMDARLPHPSHCPAWPRAGSRSGAGIAPV